MIKHIPLVNAVVVLSFCYSRSFFNSGEESTTFGVVPTLVLLVLAASDFDFTLALEKGKLRLAFKVGETSFLDETRSLIDPSFVRKIVGVYYVGNKKYFKTFFCKKCV